LKSYARDTVAVLERRLVRLFVSLALAGVVLSLFGWVNLEAVRLPWICPLKALTGHPCPGCGMTDAARALMEGHFREAAERNPNVYPLALWAILVAFAPERLFARFRGSPIAKGFYGLWLALVLGWWLLRF